MIIDQLTPENEKALRALEYRLKLVIVRRKLNAYLASEAEHLKQDILSKDIATAESFHRYHSLILKD